MKNILTLLLIFCTAAGINAQTQKKQQDSTMYHQNKNAIRNTNNDSINRIDKPNRYPADTTRKNFPPHTTKDIKETEQQSAPKKE